MRNCALFLFFSVILFAHHLLLSADPSQFPSDKTWYTVQIKSVSRPEKENGLQIYRSLKQKGYLVYYYQTKVKQTDYIRIRVGVFNTLSEAKAFGKQLQQDEGFDYYVDNARCEVTDYQKQFQIITTPSAIWYKNQQTVKEIFRLGKDKINRAYVSYESKASIAPQGDAIVFYYDDNIIKIDLAPGTPTILKEEMCQSAPKWSPDGQYIAYMDCQQWEYETRLWVMQADGSHSQCLTPETKSYKVKSFLWHPRKNEIFYVWGYAYGTVSVGGRLYSITLDGDRKAVVTPKKKGQEVFYDFRIEDKTLIYKIATFDDERFNAKFTTHSIQIVKDSDPPLSVAPKVENDRSVPDLTEKSTPQQQPDSMKSETLAKSIETDESVSEDGGSTNWYIVIPVIILILFLVFKFFSLFKTKGGLLIGAGWLPEYRLIDEARRHGAFKNCNKVICMEGPAVIDRHVAMYLYLNTEKKENWEPAEHGLMFNDFNMGSGRKMWAIYPKS